MRRACRWSDCVEAHIKLTVALRDEHFTARVLARMRVLCCLRAAATRAVLSPASPACFSRRKRGHRSTAATRSSRPSSAKSSASAAHQAAALATPPRLTNLPSTTKPHTRRSHGTDRGGMDRHARRETVADRFLVKRPRLFEGERVLLIDDVFTTDRPSPRVPRSEGSGSVSVFVLQLLVRKITKGDTGVVALVGLSSASLI